MRPNNPWIRQASQASSKGTGRMSTKQDEFIKKVITAMIRFAVVLALFVFMYTIVSLVYISQLDAFATVIKEEVDCKLFGGLIDCVLTNTETMGKLEAYTFCTLRVIPLEDRDVACSRQSDHPQARHTHGTPEKEICGCNHSENTVVRWRSCS